MQYRSLHLPSFQSGFVTNRSPFDNSVLDAPWDGSYNMEHMQDGTWAIRGSVPSWSSFQILNTEGPLNDLSVIFNSTVENYLDTTARLLRYTSTVKTTVWTKTSTARMGLVAINGIVYGTNGDAADYIKIPWGLAAKKWGITGPTTAVALVIGGGGGTFRARIGYVYSFAYKDSVDAHTSSAVTVSADTTNFNNKLFVQARGAYSSEARVDTIEIYRTKDGGSTLFKVTSAPYNNVTPAAPVAALAGLGAGNVNNGTHSYKVGFRNALGLESAGSAKSNVVTTSAGNGQVALSSIPVGPAGTTTRIIYRTVAGDTGDWKKVGTVADNVTTTFADNIADGSLGTETASPTGFWQLIDTNLDTALDTTKIAALSNVNDPPIASMTDVVYHNGRLFGIVGNKVYWSSGPDAFIGVGDECWPPLNYHQYPATAVALVSNSRGLLVFLQNGDIHVIVGFSPNEFQTYRVKQFIGISSPNQLCVDGDEVFIFTNSNRLFRFGDTLDDIGFPIQPTLDFVVPSQTKLVIHFDTRRTAIRTRSDYSIWLMDHTYRSPSTVTVLFKFNLITQTWSTPFYIGADTAQHGYMASVQTTVTDRNLLFFPLSGMQQNIAVYRSDGVYNNDMNGVSPQDPTLQWNWQLAPPGAGLMRAEAMVTEGVYNEGVQMYVTPETSSASVAMQLTNVQTEPTAPATWIDAHESYIGYTNSVQSTTRSFLCRRVNVCISFPNTIIYTAIVRTVGLLFNPQEQ